MSYGDRMRNFVFMQILFWIEEGQLFQANQETMISEALRV